jgi:hypothetical protein
MIENLKHISVFTQVFFCFLALTFIACGAESRTYALSPGEKLAEGSIDADVTWYDFGDYSWYNLTALEGTGLYELRMGNEGGDTGKTAFVNGNGELVLEPVASEQVGFSWETDGATGVYKNGSDYILISAAGLQKIDGAAYSEIGNFHDGYATVTLKQNAHKGVIDRNGALVFEDTSGEYIDFAFAGGGIFAAKLTENSLRYVNGAGVPLTETVYAGLWGNSRVGDGRILAIKNGKYGYLDMSGEEIIPLIYNDALTFSGGAAAVCLNEKWGLIDPAGNEVLPIEFDRIYLFESGLAGVVKNEKWGLADKTGAFVFPVEYDQINSQKNGYVTAVKDGRAVLTDASGQPVFTGEYSYIGQYENGLFTAEKIINGLRVNALLDANEAMLTGWKDFYLYESGGLYLGKRAGDYPPDVAPPHDYSQKFALFDTGGNNLTGFKYSNAGNARGGYQVVNLQYYYTAGLLNQYGAEVIPTVFDDILLTDEGGAFVTVRDSSDENNINNTCVGYFKIPAGFSEKKTTRPVTVYLDGVDLFFESDPVIVNERTMVPMRKIFETLGATVEWDESARTVSAGGGGTDLQLTIDSDVAYVNGAEIRLDAAPFIQDDITFVPLRFVSEASGAEVLWDGDLRRALITQR